MEEELLHPGRPDEEINTIIIINNKLNFGWAFNGKRIKNRAASGKIAAPEAL